jgi:hypothetical protein
MFAGITSVGLVTRPAEEDVPDAPVLPVVAVDCELVQPATATAQQMRKITAINVLAFIPDDKEGTDLFVRYDLLALC